MRLAIAALALTLALTLAPAARAADSLTGDTAAPGNADDGVGAITTAPAAKPAKKHRKTKKAAAASAATATDAKADAKPKVVNKDDGLVIEDLKVGSGMEAKEGSRVKVHYKGTFMNGKVFDQNMEETAEKIQPFTLDKDHLIAGWVEGIPGMKVGGKRKLKVPFKLAYGENGTPDGTIPPRADLNFEVELLKVE